MKKMMKTLSKRLMPRLNLINSQRTHLFSQTTGLKMREKLKKKIQIDLFSVKKTA